MRTTTAALASAGVVAAMALAGCGSSGGSGGSGGASGSSSGGGNASPKLTAACKLSSPPKSAAKLPKPVNLGKTHGKVGVILPDTTSSTRYTLYDKPLLTKALSAAGLTADVQNAQGSTAKFASIAQNMIGEGVKVLIMDSIDPQSGAGVEKAATKAGVKVIDYDRVNLGGSAQYYVSFDNEDVGRLQGQTLVDCLNQQGVKDPKIVMMDGGTDVDNNAVLFKKGAHEVLDPLQKAGKLKIVNEQVVKGWTISNAAPAFQQAMTAVNGDMQGVIAANDDIANAVIGVLKTNGLAGHVVVTGQDSGTEGLQNILTGKQSMTIFKNVKLEANAAAQLAIALMENKSPTAGGMKLVPFKDPNKPSHKIQALLLPSEVITQSNVNDVVKAGALTKSEVCKGIASACSKAGL